MKNAKPVNKQIALSHVLIVNKEAPNLNLMVQVLKYLNVPQDSGSGRRSA